MKTVRILLFMALSIVACSCNLSDYDDDIKDLMTEDEANVSKSAQDYIKNQYGASGTTEGKPECLFDTIVEGSTTREYYTRKWIQRMKTGDGKKVVVSVDFNTEKPACGDDIRFAEWRDMTEEYIRRTFKFPNIKKVIVQRGSCLNYFSDDSQRAYITVYLVNAPINLRKEYKQTFIKHFFDDNELGGYYVVSIYNFKSEQAYNDRNKYLRNPHEMRSDKQTDCRIVKGYYKFYSSIYGGHPDYSEIYISETGGTKVMTPEDAEKFDKMEQSELSFSSFLKYAGTVYGQGGEEGNGSQLTFHVGSGDKEQGLSVYKRSTNSDEVGILQLNVINADYA